ncbi:MAG: hypothetical protein APR54_11000 [Candidatus Cloacimonas sp. SDB]|nr:MAG: hypothetical protein APR54_11000 [Candidatus Cloacimonas sp. SDB]
MEDRKKILDLIAQGKITAAEGAKLLEALIPETKAERKSKRLVVQIWQEDSEKPKLNIALPLNLAKLGLSFIPKNSQFKTSLNNSDFDFSQINWQDILDLAASGETGELFYLEVEEQNNKPFIIKILVE